VSEDLSLATAADKWGISESYLRDILSNAETRSKYFPNSYKDSQGHWRVPFNSPGIARQRALLTPKIKARVREMVEHKEGSLEDIAGRLGISLRSVYNVLNEVARNKLGNQEMITPLKTQLDKRRADLAAIAGDEEEALRRLDAYMEGFAKELSDAWRSRSAYPHLTEEEYLRMSSIERAVVNSQAQKHADTLRGTGPKFSTIVRSVSELKEPIPGLEHLYPQQRG
jgi:hypothetical protein